nr:MAG TPA: hypothetical protein [Caudoviricetes sp.]DAQ50490.1 MAG TPA: hypothetical protein [Caudoviricetes sp.]DAR40707.1 MAG TPA: hypothetical protein [Caudoviricetes sp.]DAV11786.1 MAG TPA: hypothetical protein [Caudoviricetes sp.]
MQCSKTKERFLFQRIRELIRLLYHNIGYQFPLLHNPNALQ